MTGTSVCFSQPPVLSQEIISLDRADLPQVPDGQLLLGAGFVDVKGKVEVLVQGSWRSPDNRGQGRLESMRGNTATEVLVTVIKVWNPGTQSPRR